MTMQTMTLSPGRINRFKGEILKHAVVQERLAKGGRQVKMPKNSSDTYVARRWVPYGATVANPNQFFANGTGDRANAVAQAHLTQEGVTPLPDSIVPMDVSVVMQQYSCLYGFTDKVYNLYEDDIPAAMTEQVGQRMALVNEMIVFGGLRASTNQFYAGTGTSRATVNGALTLPFLRKIAKSLMANHGRMVTRQLAASPNYNTQPVSSGYIVDCHTDLEPDIRDLPNFTPVEKYATGTPMEGEIGTCERFRFVTSPEFPSLQDAGAAVGATGLFSTTGANIDVYQVIVSAEDAWSQVAVRGMEGMQATALMPGMKTKSDPFGQRGYVGAIWWKAVLIENPGWLAIGNVGAKTL